MATLIVDGVAESLPEGAAIMEACQLLGVPFGCRGGECGTCLIIIESGAENLSPLNDIERNMGLDPGNRLACQARILQGVVEATW